MRIIQNVENNQSEYKSVVIIIIQGWALHSQSIHVLKQSYTFRHMYQITFYTK